MQDERRRSKDCAGPLETDLRWKEVFTYEQALIDKRMADYELERQVTSSPNLFVYPAITIHPSISFCFLLGREQVRNSMDLIT